MAGIFIIFGFFGFILYYFIRFAILGITGKDISPIGLIVKLFNKTTYTKNAEIYTDILRSFNFRYFMNLEKQQQELFLTRLAEFIYEKEFIPHDISEITTKHKVLISATAIQLSFGLDRYLLSNFSKIHIFPTKYYSDFTHEYHKGDVNLDGSISLSFEDFLKGYDDTSDGVNLGYHEMAHALKFDRFFEEEPNDYFTNYYYKWYKTASIEFDKLQDDENSFLRTYAKTNINEFFAVCLENFFERPQEFKIAMPELYNKITLLLNQDPINAFHPRLYRKSSPKNALLEPQKFVFSSNINFDEYIGITIKLIFSIIFSSIFLFVDSSISYLAFIIIISFFCLIFLAELSKYKQFCVSENYVVVRSNFITKHIISAYNFNDIVLVNVDFENYKIIAFKYFENEKITEKRYEWISTVSEYKKFVSHLTNKDVAIIKQTN